MKTFRLALTLLAVMAVASTSYAGLLIDVRPVAGPGYTVAGKNVTFDAAGSYPVNYEMWAVVTGDNATLTDDGVQTVYGGVRNTAGASANTNQFTTFTKAQYVDPFAADTSASVTVAPNLIGLEGGTTGSMIMRSLTMLVNTDTTNSYKLAAFTSQATVGCARWPSLRLCELCQAGWLTWALSLSESMAVSKNGTAAGAALVTAGAPVTLTAGVVPEPGTLVLLGMGGLGLVCLWRRKRA